VGKKSASVSVVVALKLLLLLGNIANEHDSAHMYLDSYVCIYVSVYCFVFVIV